jgi:hypothetical protein
MFYNLAEIRRKGLSTFWLHHSHYFFHHRFLLFLRGRTQLISCCDLQYWLFISRMILRKALVEPHLQIASFIEAEHLIIDLKVPYFAIAVLVPSDYFAEHIYAFYEGEPVE